MDRRRFLKTAAGLFIPAAPAIIRPEIALAQMWPFPGPGRASAGDGSTGLQTNLSAFFSLDNTLADSTGNVTDLTNNNSVTFVSSSPSPIAAVSNTAKFVASSSQSLSHTNVTDINVAGINFSISFWCWPQFANRQLLSKGGGGFGNREYNITYGFGDGVNNPISGTTDDNTIRASSNTPRQTWHHVVMTWNNTSKAMVLYLDGSSFSSTTESNATAGTSTLFMGADNAGTGGFLDGNMCLFGTWRNRILSAGDVTLLYNSGAGLSYTQMA